MANQVKIVGERGYYQVMVDGVQLGKISGSRGEFWLTTGVDIVSAKFLARFKYRGLTPAKHFAKWLFGQGLQNDLLAALDAGLTPMGFAEARGYVRPAPKSAKRAA